MQKALAVLVLIASALGPAALAQGTPSAQCRTAIAAAERGLGIPDRLMQAFTDRTMAEAVLRVATDERIRMYQSLVNYQPTDAHYQTLLAGTYIQKMRETMDPGYLDRASKIVESVLANDRTDYPALRLRSWSGDRNEHHRDHQDGEFSEHLRVLRASERERHNVHYVHPAIHR